MTVNRLAESLRLAIAWAYIAIMGAMVSLAPVSAQALIQPVPNAVMSVAGNTPDASGNVTLPTTFSGIAMYNSTINGAPMASTADVANAVVGLDALSARQAAISGLSAVYQPVGSYLTPTALTPYLTSSAAASTYETPSQTAALYQPLGSYLTSGALAPYPTTTQMNAAIAAAIPAPYAFSVGATPNARALALATAYQCTNAAKPCIVYASITTTTSLTLGTGTTNTQNIIVGTTTAVASGTGSVLAVNSTALTLAGVSVALTSTSPVSFIVPAGQYFAIRATSGTATISNAYDQSLG